ncbi:MAG: hypothetical protein QE278_01000 [Limnobacter sp.]|nr:hypothetical protein [Limnobacter sp.]
MRVLMGKLSRWKTVVLFTAAMVPNLYAYAASAGSQVQASMDAKNFEQVELLSLSALNSPLLDPLDRAYFQQSLLIAYLQTDQHSKLVQLLDQLLLESPQDTSLLALRTKGYYLLGNPSKTLQSAQVELMVLKEKGAKPGEGLLQLHTQAARHLNDQNALLKGLKLWASLYPNSESWSELIEACAQAGVFRVAGDLHLYRLMLATEGFGAPGEYLDAAEIFTRKGFYLEAQAALDLAVRKGALPNAELGELYREKRKQVSLLLQQVDDEGAGSISALLGDSGDAWLTEGYLQVLAGDRLAGVNTMEKGMAKGRFVSPSTALLTFAEGLWFAGFRAEARLEFERLSADPQLAPVAELWALTFN